MADDNDIPFSETYDPEDPEYRRAAAQPAEPPPVDLPYGQSHEMELQRLTSGLGEVERAMGNETLDRATGSVLIAKIMQQLGPLQQRKQQAAAQAQQQQQTQLLNQTAMEQGIKAIHQQSDAANFLKGAATITDPETGKTVHYVQTKPGEFEPVDFGEADRPVDDGAGDATPGEADRPIEPPAVTVTPTENGTHRMTIWNGNHRQDYEYPSGGGSAQLVYDSRPPGQQQAQQQPDSSYLSDHERTVARMKAEQQYAGMPPGPKRTALVVQAATHYEKVTERENRDRITRQRQVEEHQRQEQTRQTLVEQKKDQQIHADKWLQNKNAHLKNLTADWQAANATDGVKKPAIPDEVRDALSDQANRMADQDHIDAYGEEHLPASRKAARAKAQQPAAAQPQSQPPPKPAVPPHVAERLNKLKDADAKEHAAAAQRDAAAQQSADFIRRQAILREKF